MRYQANCLVEVFLFMWINRAKFVLQGEDEEGETDNLVNEVLDEIGINLSNDLVSAPHQQAAAAEEEPQERQQEAMAMGGTSGRGGPPKRPPGNPPLPPPPGGGGGGGGMPEPSGSGIDDDLQARLNNLRKP